MYAREIGRTGDAKLMEIRADAQCQGLYIATKCSRVVEGGHHCLMGKFFSVIESPAVSGPVTGNYNSCNYIIRL